MQSKRLDYLDFIKGISIVLVVFCHRVVIPDDSVIGTAAIMLSYAAVPCFMMCSGYVLLFRQESARRSLQRAWHVYACMVIWKALYFLYFHLFESIEWTPVSLLHYLFLFAPLKGVETEHFWFLKAYLPAMLITPLLAPVFSQRRYGMAAGFTGLAYLSNQFVMSANLVLQLLSSRVGTDLLDVDLLSHIFPLGGEYSSMLVCFMLGGVHRLLEEKNITRKPLFVLASFLCAAGGTAVMMGVRYLQMGSFEWRGTLMIAQYEWSSTLVMSFGVFGLLRCLGDTRPARWIGSHVGRHSMGIFYLHYLCLIPLMVYVYPLLPTALWVNVAKTLAVVAFCTLLTGWGKKIPLVRTLLR